MPRYKVINDTFGFQDRYWKAGMETDDIPHDEKPPHEHFKLIDSAEGTKPVETEQNQPAVPEAQPEAPIAAPKAASPEKSRNGSARGR